MEQVSQSRNWKRTLVFFVCIDALVIALALFTPFNSIEENPLDGVAMADETHAPADDLELPDDTPQASVQPQADAETQVQTEAPQADELTPAPIPAKNLKIAKHTPPAAAKVSEDEDTASDPQSPEAAPTNTLEAAVEAPPDIPAEMPTPPTRDAEDLRAAPAAENKAPPYPDEDREAHREGTVHVRFFVSPQGDVERTMVTHNTGSSAMGESAVEMLRTHHYDTNQTGWWEKDFKFSLSE